MIDVNLGDYSGQARVYLPWPEFAGDFRQLREVLARATYNREGNDVLSPGLYVELARCFFKCVL